MKPRIAIVAQDLDAKTLLKMAVRYDTPLAINLATANAVLTAITSKD